MRLTHSSINTGKPYLKRASDEKESMTKPTVTQVLTDAFGSDFSEATQDQRLLLLEAIAFVLRSRWCWLDSLGVCMGSSRLPEECFVRATLSTNEGLKLIAILNVAIVEGYSVLAASERGLM